MPVCPAVPCDVVPAAAGEAGLGLLGQAEMVAVRVADLAWPARRGPGTGGRTALTAAGAGKIRAGDLVVFCKPVAMVPAVVGRDGRVQAAGLGGRRRSVPLCRAQTRRGKSASFPVLLSIRRSGLVS
jgi:hypothetical protein